MGGIPLHNLDLNKIQVIDTISLLEEMNSEIKMLRNQNQLMSARLEMFDNIMALLHTDVATKSQGMSEDIVYKSQKFIESIKNIMA